jgi:hypothetical protein
MADVQLAVIDGPGDLVLNLAVPGTQGPVGVGFPASGGTIHQVLIKNSSADYDATWTSSWNISSLTINDGTY